MHLTAKIIARAVISDSIYRLKIDLINDTGAWKTNLSQGTIPGLVTGTLLLRCHVQQAEK